MLHLEQDISIIMDVFVCLVQQEGFLRSFGVDRGSTLPWTDIHETDCLFIAGSNTAECHPTSMFRDLECTRKRRLFNCSRSS